MKNVFKLLIIAVSGAIIAGCSFLPSQLQGNNIPAANNYMPNQSNPNPAELNAQQTAKNPNTKNTAMDSEDVIEEKPVIVSIGNSGRSDPFRPYQERYISAVSAPREIINNIPISEIPLPPLYAPNPSVSNLLTVKVSGILYEKNNPSAIINIKDNDYTVKEGDKLFSYKVVKITPDKVTIKTANNVYTVGLGEVIDGEVNVNPVKGTNSIPEFVAKIPSSPPAGKPKEENKSVGNQGNILINPTLPSSLPTLPITR